MSAGDFIALMLANALLGAGICSASLRMLQHHAREEGWQITLSRKTWSGMVFGIAGATAIGGWVLLVVARFLLACAGDLRHFIVGLIAN